MIYVGSEVKYCVPGRRARKCRVTKIIEASAFGMHQTVYAVVFRDGKKTVAQKYTLREVCYV